MLRQRSIITQVAVGLGNLNFTRLVIKSIIESAASRELIFEHHKAALFVLLVQAGVHLFDALLFFKLKLSLISLDTLQLLLALIVIDFLVFFQFELLVALLLLPLSFLFVLVAETLLLLLVQLFLVVDDPQVSLVALLLAEQALLDQAF